MNTLTAKLLALTATVAISAGAARADDSGLVGHWKLHGDAKDRSGNGNDGRNRGADLTATGPGGEANGAARFDGRDDFIEVADSEALDLGGGNFTIAAWVHTDEKLGDVLGDIAGKFDPATRRGFNFSIQNYAGVTTHQPNYRNVFFGIDSGTGETKWIDRGRPGNNLFVYAMAVYEGQLYAGTFETGEDEAGHVYRYAGRSEWVDCGSPDRCNAVTSLAVYDGKLYAGVSRYRARGSALPDSPNEHPGGKIYRYEGGSEWTDCGKLGDADAVFSLLVFDGKLYSNPIYHQGVYRYEGGTSWTHVGTPGRRLMAMTVFNGSLYAAGNEGRNRGGVFRYDGKSSWIYVGDQPGTTQTYSFAAYGGKMYVGTWPTGSVFRDDGQQTWTNTGRLGDEKEVMGMAVYNGKLYAGTLPLAQVYRYDGDSNWTLTGRLDHTPEVRYRRAWSMAVFDGKLFCGTLPSGHVYSLEAGKCVTYDRELAPGWRHLAAVRGGDRLKLYVDGEVVATSAPLDSPDFNITNDQPLKIGFGTHDHFRGAISDLRIYNRALDDVEVNSLCAPR